MKNFSVQVSDGVKRIVLAGLVCLTAVLVSAVAINGAKKEADVGNAFAATTVTTYATCASNNGMLGCDSKTPTCVYTTSGASTTYKSTACANGCYGGKCIAGCTYSTSDPKGASAAQCTENNQYCSKDNLCYPGCYGYDANGQLEVVTSGKSTCAKPGQDASQAALAPDAVYKCQGAPKYDIKNNISGTVTNWTTNSDGSLTKYGVTGLFYNEDNESEVCNYADCYNGACTGNGESDNLCSKTAAKIKAAFDKYMGYKKANTIKIALDKISNDTTLKDADKTAQMKAKIKEFKESLLTILNAAKIGSSGDDPDSGKDAEIMKQLEKMIFPADYAVTENMLWGGKNDGSLPIVKALKRTQISCQYLSNNPINSWCPADPSEDFFGFSYKCEDNILNGCDMFSWVDTGADKCKTDEGGAPITVESFPIWRTNGYKMDEIITDADGRVGFMKDADGWGGKVTGGAGNGCAYDSYVSPTGYSYDATNQIVGATGYDETNKAFTGACWAITDAQASGGSGTDNKKNNKIGCADPKAATDDSANNSTSEKTTGTSTDTTAGNAYSEGDYTCQNNKPYICKASTWTAVASCDAADDDCNNVCKKNADTTCKSDDDCHTDGQYCVFDDLDSKEGNCDTKGCRSKNNDNKVFGDGAVVCGSDDNSYKCTSPTSISDGNSRFWKVNGKECGDAGCKKETGECADIQTGECKGVNVSDGTPYETTSNCGGKSCSGVCVPFTVQQEGDCSSLVCLVSSDYGKATGYQNGSSSQWYGCMTAKSGSSSSSKSSSSSSSNSDSSDSNSGTIDYTIKCTDSKSGKTDSAEGQCSSPQGSDNPLNDKNTKAKEGETCTDDTDCKNGLKCEDGKCAASCTKSSDCKSGQTCKDGACTDAKGSASEGDDCTKDSDCKSGLKCEDGTCAKETAVEAPTVTVTSPTGTVTAKTAQLTVTTNLNSNCKYMDITSGGSYETSNFSGSGMAMSSSGYTHIATLSSLANTATNTSSDCKKTHNIVVLCQNSEAKDQSSVTSIGSGQTSFTVDLSANTEYAPTVTSAMSATSFTVANPILKVTTDRPASCQYSKDNTFTYGSGTDFTTTGSYTHNTELSGLTTGNYTYYVVCKDADTCASNAGLKVTFSVALAGGTSNMAIVSVTPAKQTVSNPTISVTTDLPATCQYKADSTFTYGDGTQFTNDNDYSHTSSLGDLKDGDYKLYVVCREKETLAIKILTEPITTTLDRGVSANEPVVSNTTDVSQSTDSPIISITTKAAAKCQYSTESSFTYGNGTQFTTDGSTGHSVALSGVEDGKHTYYVVCKDVSTGTVNSNPVEITFEVSNTANTCADFDSNDRQSDDARDYNDSGSDSKYVWRSVEDGERDEFTKVDWYAGYQFTTDKDGYVTQLCGYFADGESNEVTLYNGSYKELATATVDGSDDWKCATISPVKVKSDKRYYVIARVKDGPINYEYQSGLLPLDADNVVVESGIRQLGGTDFGEDIVKYDYMVFGLVDVKFVASDSSGKGPKIDVNAPIGSIDTDSTTLSIDTDTNATCKFSREDVEYSDMEYDFGKTGGKEHEQKICKLDSGNFTFYIRCQDEKGKENDASTLLQFEVSD